MRPRPISFFGEVSERLKEHDWKSCIPTKIGIVGSNPTLSVLLLSSILVVSGCDRGLREFEQKRVLLGTTVGIKVLAPDEKLATEAMNAAFLEIKRVDSLMSLYSQKSELTKLNSLGYSRNKKLIEVVRECKKWGELTGGAFDVTIAPVFRLWDFRDRKIPEAKELQNALKLVDYRKIWVTDSLIQIPEGFEIDLGGAAKGYAVDQAVLKLKSMGIQYALVDAGGDIRALGGRGRNPWKIGVRHPRKEGVVRLIELRDASVTTSGDYERYFIKDGVRYHHILDPKTGYPTNGCVSVTILAERAMEADILSTAVMVLGPVEGKRLIKNLDNVGALIISETPQGLLVDEVGQLGDERGKILQD